MSPPSDLSARLADHLDRDPDLLPRGDRVLVAFSGGPDSTALLHLLHGLREERGWHLRAAHYDHGLREGSAGEARRVADRAEELGVPCRVGRPDGSLPAKQEALRRARYGFLREAAREVDADRIATGHQADDQAETVLFRILRGTGVRGLGGIPERRGDVVRPLLPFRREELRSWLEERGIPWLDDPSNRDPRWARARIRTRVMPALEEAWDGPVRERLLDLAAAARRADRALRARARRLLDEALEGEGGAWGEEAFRLRREPLAAADRETRGRCVRMLASRLDVRLTRGGTRAAVEFISEGRSGGRVDLGDGLELAREFDRIWLGRSDDPVPDTELTVEGPEAGRGIVHVGGRRLRVSWGRPGTGEAGAGPGGGDAPAGDHDHRGDSGEGREASAEAREVVLAPSRLQFPLRVRGWRHGDRLRTPAGSRKLKRLFNDHRIPRSRRRRLPMVADAEGQVLWAAEIGRDPEMAPDEGEPPFLMRILDA